MKIGRAVAGFLLSFVFLIIFVYVFSSTRSFFQNLPQSQNKATTLGSISSVVEKRQDTIITPGLDIQAQAAISVQTNLSDPDKIIFSKNADRILSIASISKLMTALVVLDNNDLSQEIKIDNQAAHQSTDTELLKEGETYYAKDLFYAMLIGSDNTASYALSEGAPSGSGTDKFVELMNKKAKDLGLLDTSFSNTTGLNLANFSTAQDLVKLAKYLTKNYPSILAITTTKEFDIHTVDGKVTHKIINTDELVSDSSDLTKRIVGGKTGETRTAGQCLLLVTKDLNNQDYLINVILNSTDRFGEMKKIINWADMATNKT